MGDLDGGRGGFHTPLTVIHNFEDTGESVLGVSGFLQSADTDLDERFARFGSGKPQRSLKLFGGANGCRIHGYSDVITLICHVPN